MNELLFTIIGYIAFTVYTCGIMFLGMLVERKTGIDKTVCRKLTHIVSAFVWVICYYFFGCSVHWVILNGVGTVALGVITFCGLMDSYDRDDAKKSYGLFYFGLSTFVVALICYLYGEELYLYTGIAYYCLALGDGFAPIVAKLFKKHNPSIMENRSVAGTATVFAVSFLSAFTFSQIFGMHLGVLFLLSVAALTCVTEFYGIKGIDNLLIEFGVFGYLLLYHFGYVTLIFEIVILVSPFLACIAIKSRSLSVSGGITSLILFYIIGFFGSEPVPVLFTAILFLIATVISFVTHRIYNSRNNSLTARHMRTGKQILAVGFVASICLIIYYFTDKPFFYALFFLALTEQFADSMASDIGRLTKGRNIDITKFRPIAKGLSGGISLLGTLCAAVGSFILALIPLIFGSIGLESYIALSLIAFCGTLIDSVLGSLLQALYRCNICGAYTEDEIHCSGRTELVKGFSIVGNTTVNLMTSFLTCIIGCLLLLI